MAFNISRAALQRRGAAEICVGKAPDTLQFAGIALVFLVFARSTRIGLEKWGALAQRTSTVARDSMVFGPITLQYTVIAPDGVASGIAIFI
jgi:hypothetical protein